ncbi:nucleotidyl transferase AbiEii/AbiGii toxin family protein [Pontibacter sp. G13]|uniref:nucleotidyl transferase AbiEii/AbiGii toxin family protein n=1 Tax=Pontibacter sp. G13 TaxID=3074898 RepID=UPI0028891A6C|nr:nucleotidyl transferase AbiEii/AbiGii toxin family protein [Pontibacter sp. G13]WNJ21378.1 nucleotidyl transferase AbiEii/AbiGii toxin family protein [Pontibacter sp. G13]
MPAKSIEHIQQVAASLGNLRSKMVFIGGSVLDLYVTDEAAPENRPTGDIDCVVSVDTLADFFPVTHQLEEKGFRKVSEAEHPAYSWLLNDILIHLIPRVTLSAGFSSYWYSEGVYHAQPIKLANGHEIKVFPVAFYIASKIEAFLQRGGGDFRSSEDFEDIVYVMDNRPSIAEDIHGSFYEVRGYIQKKFSKFLSDPELEEGVYCVLPPTSDPSSVEKIMSIMQEVVSKDHIYSSGF